MALDLGVFLPTLTRRDAAPVDPVAAARHAEALGFESVWVVDQLVAGTGVPILDSTVVLSAVAGATERVKLAFGVTIVPLHPTVWLAKQVASLQHISGDRVLLGVGVGGDRHRLAWTAAGADPRRRGRETDAALAVLPDLIAGKPVELARLAAAPGSIGVPATDPTGSGDVVQLSPGATVPPVVVGGMSDAAVARAAAHADDWFLLPVGPDDAASARQRLREAAAAQGRPAPTITASLMALLDGDPAVPPTDVVIEHLVDPDGLFGIPADQAAGSYLAGPPAAVAERLTGFAAAGADRVVTTFPTGDWFRQTELLAEAAALL